MADPYQSIFDFWIQRLIAERGQVNKKMASNKCARFQPTIKNSVQLWSLHTLFPSSWRQIFCLPVEEVFYTFPSCSYSQPKLFVLVVAIFVGVAFHVEERSLFLARFGAY